MNELIAQTMFYPEMELQDAVKLLYQQTFGSGHLIVDPAEDEKRLKQEYEAAQGDMPLIEPIGGGISRLHLAPAKKEGISPKLIQKLFLMAYKEKKEQALFLQKLQELVKVCQKGLLPFDPAEAEIYVNQYMASGCPAVSHSQAYRQAYAPSYRLIPSETAKLLPVLMRLDQWQGESPYTIAIDGKCGSGKSTLAAFLQKLFPCTVIHMDDFFLPPSLRTPKRLAEAGGNIHYERFEREVLPFLSQKEDFSYRRFDCSCGDYGETRTVKGLLRVVEGSYSMHPKFEKAYNDSIFLDIDGDLQEQRILSRGNEEILKDFKEKWIPMEEHYFKETAAQSRCAFSVKNLCLPL